MNSQCICLKVNSHNHNLKKRNKSHTGAIDRAEALNRVDFTRYHTLSWNVRLITSRCCSRDSLLKFTA